MTALAFPLVAAGSIQASLVSAAVVENSLSPGSVVNISPEMTGCPQAGSYVDCRDAWSTRWHGRAIGRGVGLIRMMNELLNMMLSPNNGSPIAHSQLD
ncbi:MAG: hypothetical protein WBV77_05060 [Solirubrobacteraceae bacterium]